MRILKFNGWTALAGSATALTLLLFYTTYLGGVFYFSRLLLIAIIPVPFWYIAVKKSQGKKVFINDTSNKPTTDKEQPKTKTGYWHWLVFVGLVALYGLVLADIWVFIILAPNFIYNAVRAYNGKKTMFWKIFAITVVALILLYFLTSPPYIPNANG